MEDSQLPKSRAEALAQGVKFYFTGLPCSRGHVTKRKTKGSCVECQKEDTRASNVRRTEYFKAYNRREGVQDKKHDWYVANSAAVKTRASTRPKEVRRVYQDAWKARNINKVRADTKARRRKHRVATPVWLTAQQKKAIRQLYLIAIHMTKATGMQYVVDHIIPLRGESCCGLHVPWNLQVMTQDENLRKGNALSDSTGLAFPAGSGPVPLVVPVV